MSVKVCHVKNILCAYDKIHPMNKQDVKQQNEETRAVWNQNAAFWDGRMGDGNDFVDVLTWPPTQRLLEIKPGERILDIACGNGLTSRRMAALGAHVTACDFAKDMIALAQKYQFKHANRIQYRVLDATDEAALLALGEGSYDSALCAMGLFDMAEIDPLLRAMRRLLKPGGKFVFSILHPCFNGPTVRLGVEEEDRQGEIVTQYSLKITAYMTPTVNHAIAIRGQPRAQLIFHRPLQVLLGSCFNAGFVLDALEERSFPPDHPIGKNPLAWGARFSEFPPAMVARVRSNPH
jgi:2-polyprenyl-3-methyl-5-hydroxy-6-metoxy-1,4-benzoquinol methylase